MQNKTFEGIKENKLFTWIDPDFINRLKFDQKKFFAYKKGSIIYRINDESDLLYMVVEGEVKLRYYDYKNTSGSEVIKIKNDFFGEKEILYRSPRSSAASAEKDCLLYGLSITDLPRYLIRKLYYMNNAAFPEHEYTSKSNKIFEPSQKNKADLKTRFVRIKAPGKMNYYRELKKLPGTESSFLKENIFLPAVNVDQDLILKSSLEGNKALPESVGSLLTGEAFLKQQFSELKKISNDASDILPEHLTERIKSLALSVNIIHASENKPAALLSESARLLDCERCFLFEADGGNNELISSNGIKFKIGLGITGTAAERNEVIFSNNVKYDPRFVPEYECRPGVETRSMLCLPLKDQVSNVPAVLQFINKKGEFTDKDKYFLEAASPFLIPFTRKEIDNENSEKIFLSRYAESISSTLDGSIQSIKNLVRTLYRLNAGFEARKLAEAVYKQAELAEFLLLTLKESAGEDIPCQSEAADFHNLMENLLQAFADFAASKNIVLLKKNNAEGSVFLDKRRFEQACFNIISYWCRKLDEGGKIYIKTENDGKMIRIEFKTSGYMIPGNPELSEHNGPGSSFFITESIIEKSGGSIEASGSLQEQKFIIYLPLSKD